MVTRKIKISIGEFYHVYNRRNDKKLLFIDDFDKERFVKLLFLCNSRLSVNMRDLPEGVPFGNDKGEPFDRGETLVSVGAYCLMPNHFHLLLKEKVEGGISKFLGKLATAYSMYFNKKYGRTGSLFEGRFKAVHINNDEHLRYLFAYIHLNPLKLIDPFWKEKGISNPEKAKQFLGSQRFSSYLDYSEDAIGQRRVESILEKLAFPKYFASIISFDNFIDEWIKFTKGGPL